MENYLKWKTLGTIENNDIIAILVVNEKDQETQSWP